VDLRVGGPTAVTGVRHRLGLVGLLVEWTAFFRASATNDVYRKSDKQMWTDELYYVLKTLRIEH
jgi:hypothetical protein